MKNDDNNVAEMTFKMINQRSTLKMDIEVFAVNPLDFFYFVAMFEKIVNRKIEYPHRKVMRLIKYITDEVN